MVPAWGEDRSKKRGRRPLAFGAYRKGETRSAPFQGGWPVPWWDLWSQNEAPIIFEGPSARKAAGGGFGGVGGVPEQRLFLPKPITQAMQLHLSWDKQIRCPESSRGLVAWWIWAEGCTARVEELNYRGPKNVRDFITSGMPSRRQRRTETLSRTSGFSSGLRVQPSASNRVFKDYTAISSEWRACDAWNETFFSIVTKSNGGDDEISIAHWVKLGAHV